jgi:hypothetical protein
MNSSVSFMGFCGPSSGGANTTYGPTMFQIFSNSFFMRWKEGYLQKSSENITTQTIMTGIGLTSSGKYYRNNLLQSTSFVSAPLTNNYTQLGYSNNYSNANAQEAIIYLSNQDLSVNDINTNINNYYNVF